jgi:probable DNA metabolism protein
MTLRSVALKEGADLGGFQRALRQLLAADVAPPDVAWIIGDTPSLLGDAVCGEAPPITLPRSVVEAIEDVVCHRDPQRYALLHSLVWRFLHGERAVLAMHNDPLVHRIEMLRKAIRRDLHKMHAFLRFRCVAGPGGTERFVAWFEPGHFIVEATAAFFVDRFRGLVWLILTPVGSLHWDREHLLIGPPGRRGDTPDGDGFEAGWCSYYESVFNPARVNATAMRAQMAKKYWRNMPEAAAIPQLIRSAPARTQAMIERDATLTVRRNPDKAVAAMLRRRDVREMPQEE